MPDVKRVERQIKGSGNQAFISATHQGWQLSKPVKISKAKQVLPKINSDLFN
jgi:hypothetical protein